MNKEDNIDTKKLQQTLVSPERPAPLKALASIGTFTGRSLLKLKHNPMGLMDVILMPILFLLMFTYLFGGAIAGSVKDYLQFILPGILVQTVMQITIYTGLNLKKDIDKGFFDRQRTLPIWLPSSLVGALSYDTLRYVITSFIMITFGMILGFRPEGGFLGVVAAIALLLVFSFSLSWIWNAMALVVKAENIFLISSMMVIFPLTFLSSAFVDPETMPRVLKIFTNINPISKLVDAIRGLMHGNVVGMDIIWTLIISGIIIAIFGPITMHLYKNKN